MYNGEEDHPHWPLAVQSWSEMCDVEDELTPHQPLAVESWSDMYNVEEDPDPH